MKHKTRVLTMLLAVCCVFGCSVAAAAATGEPDTLPLADTSQVIYELEKSPYFAGSYTENEVLHVLSTRPASLSKTAKELAARYGVSIVVDLEAVTYSYTQQMDAQDKLTESMVELDIWQIALDEMENRLEVTSEKEWNSAGERAASKAAGLSRNAFLFLTAPNTFTLVYPEEIEQNDVLSANSDAGVQMAADRPLNVRSGPGMSHDVIGGLNTGDVVTILEQNGNWAQIRYANGAVGYAFFDYLDPYSGPEDIDTESSSSTTTTATATGNVNVRSGPGTSYKKLGKLKKGQTVSINVLFNDDWAEINYNNRTAYVSTDYLRIENTSDIVLDMPSTDPGTVGSAVATGNVNVRTGPGTSYSKLGKLKRGQTVSVWDVSGKWAQITWQSSSVKAYVHINYLRFEP